MKPIEKIEALKKKYYHDLPEKLALIQTLFDKGVEKGFDAEIFGEVLRHVHDLSGTGATFGLLELSRKAKVLEDALKPFVFEGEAPSAKVLDELNILMRSLSSAFQSPSTSNENSVEDLSGPLVDSKLKKKHAAINIYLIDDDPYIHGELKIHLQSFGYSVESFFDIKSFVVAVKLKAPDVVLMDLMFSEGHEEGIRSIHRLKKQMPKPFALLFISAKDDFISRANAVKVGSDGFIAKPVSIKSLIEKIDRLTEQQNIDPIRVLILDDEVYIAEFHAAILNNAGIDTFCINNPEEVLNAMSQYQPDLLLMDFHMPHYNGLEVTKVIRQMDEYLSIPIIYLSGERDESLQNKAINEGAEDFMLKPVNTEELCNRVLNKAERYKIMRHEIQQDSLTGLYNHIAIINLLAKAIADARRHKHALSYAMIDIDHFKKVNDTYGHQAGDTVLKVLATFLSQNVRESDIIGRYGGEEFCLVFPHTSMDEAEKLMNKIRIRFKEITHRWGDETFHTTFSCGVCQWNKEMDVVGFIGHADQAMYNAKESGRDKVECCS